ncbi:hypothetical protein [Sphingomonas endolithica]|uniref:hypothetical protein n=1 Tax=Sphingomonas endolithica TaxID=2972485 RepID=UPI0021AF4961|nr:hypothetical protein [Sphingomonas sp. ZFBP2030]
MRYILSNIVPIAAATLVGLAILFLGFRSRLKGWPLAAATLALFWLSAILAGALILAPVDAGPWTVALGSAFIIWIGFVLPALSIALNVRGQSWSTSLADATWWLAIMLAQSAVLHSIGLIKPPSVVDAVAHGVRRTAT